MLRTKRVFSTCLLVLCGGCSLLTGPDYEETYHAHFSLTGHAGGQIEAALVLMIARENGGISHVRFRVSEVPPPPPPEAGQTSVRSTILVNTECTDIMHEYLGRAGTPVSCAWESGELAFTIVVTRAWRCWEGGNEVDCPPENALVISPGNFSFEDDDGTWWENELEVWAN